MSADLEHTLDRDGSLIAPAAATVASATPDQGSKPIANESKDSGHEHLDQAALVADNDVRKPKFGKPMTAMDEDLFHSALAPPGEQQEVEDGGEPGTSYQEPEEDQLLPPPEFKPFFTLIEDPESGDVHHPAVHYVFADDDQDILTDAALVAIDGPGESHLVTDTDERFLLVNMAADGKTVIDATSLSPHWQNVKATTGQAPSFTQTGEEGKSGLMLRITGEEAANISGLRQAASLDDLVRTFGEKLDTLEGMLGSRVEAAAGNTVQTDAPQELRIDV